jgi:hypothetical protein
LSGMWLGVDLSRHKKKKTLELKIDWSTCSKYASHFRLNCQHDWEDLHQAS